MERGGGGAGPLVRTGSLDLITGVRISSVTNRDRRTGAIAFGALGLMFCLIPGVAFAITQSSLGAIVVGVLIALSPAVLFAYAAWEKPLVRFAVRWLEELFSP